MNERVYCRGDKILAHLNIIEDRLSERNYAQSSKEVNSD